MAKTKHLHTYERIKGRKDYFRCVSPECSHYIHKDLLPGKLAMCKCHREYLLTSQNLKLKTPHCDECTTPRVGKQKRVQEVLATNNILKDLMGL